MGSGQGNRLRRLLGIAGLGLALGLAAPALAKPKLVSEDLMIAASDPGIRLFVRNKHPAGLTQVAPAKILLFVHGATYPAETAFDLPLGGFSWMDYIAERGYDVYLVDLRGYGRSTRPPEMDQPAEANPPIVDTQVAMRDVGAAVDFILKRRHAAKLNLLGWSWGTTIMGFYTSEHNDKVNKLVLYAPQWISNNTSLPPGMDGQMGAYRSVSMDSAKTRWLKGVAPDKQHDLIPAGWFEQWAKATLATDPIGAKQAPPLLRAPNGVLKDARAFWLAGKAQYDPGKITVPTMLVHAEWDADLPSYQAQGYFQRLTNVPYKRFVEIGEGTHTVIMEKNRLHLFHEVQLFLDEPSKGMVVSSTN
jgi:pimeloyl-ACP methyl ester carboxylesterase